MKIKIIAANNSSKNVYSIAKLFVQQYDTVSSQTNVWSDEKRWYSSVIAFGQERNFVMYCLIRSHMALPC